MRRLLKKKNRKGKKITFTLLYYVSITMVTSFFFPVNFFFPVFILGIDYGFLISKMAGSKSLVTFVSKISRNFVGGF